MRVEISGLVVAVLGLKLGVGGEGLEIGVGNAEGASEERSGVKG